MCFDQYGMQIWLFRNFNLSSENSVLTADSLVCFHAHNYVHLYTQIGMWVPIDILNMIKKVILSLIEL